MFKDLGPKKNVAKEYDLRNRVIGVSVLKSKLKADHMLTMEKFNMKNVELPHDHKFPFAVIYKMNKDYEILLLWADTLKSR